MAAIQPQEPLRPTTLAALSVLFVTASGLPVLTSCSNSSDGQYVYCVDTRTNQVVDDGQCDEEGGHGGIYALWLSGGHHNPGYTVPQSSRTKYIQNTPAARGAAGLPTTGNAAGTRTTSGGVGRGGTNGGGS